MCLLELSKRAQTVPPPNGVEAFFQVRVDLEPLQCRDIGTKV